MSNQNPDTSSLRVKDGKLVEVSGGAELLAVWPLSKAQVLLFLILLLALIQTAALRVDHACQQGSESDLMERSLHSLTKACVEGVNVAALALGSAASRKSVLLFEPIRDESAVNLVFQVLLASLEAKASALNNSSAAGISDETSGSRKKQAFAFELSVSLVEFYEETMTDLLVAEAKALGTQTRPLVMEDSSGFGGKAIANLSEHGPISSVDVFQRLLEMGKRARRNESGLYGNAREFSSAILKYHNRRVDLGVDLLGHQISLKQTFRLPDASKQELQSTLSIIDLPATDRLARPGGAVRLSEGLLLNKALFAFADVLEDCASAKKANNGGQNDGLPQGGHQGQDTRPPEKDDVSYPYFDDSHLTAMLETAISAAASERKAFELQFERLTLGLNKSHREKEELVHSWMAKLQENEELIHESESQIEAHRLKIAFLASSKDNLDIDSEGGGGGNSSGSMPLLRELISSYQTHEKQLRSQLAQLRSKTFRLEKRLRERAVGFTAATGSAGDQETITAASLHPEASSDGDTDDASTDEKCNLNLLLQEINTAQAQIALEKEKHSSSVLKGVEPEKKNQILSLECDALKLKLEQSREEEKQHADAIRVMHEALLKQLEEVRARLVQQQNNEIVMKQQQSVANVAKKLVGTQQQQKQLAAAATGNTLEANNQAAWLAEEKQRLEARLAASTRQWPTLVEQVERRCAELLTKNVMLVQENSDLREHLKIVMTRNQSRTINNT